MAIELIFASKRSPDNDTSQGNTELLGMRAVSSECIPEQAIMDQTWVRLSCLQNNTNFLQDLGLALALGNVRAKVQRA